MITNEIREKRRKYVCSSDIGALFECNPFMTAYDVWLQKMHKTENVTNDVRELGNELEETIVNWVCLENNLTICPDKELEQLQFICEDYQLFACNLDSLVSHPNQHDLYFPIEAKYTQYAQEWGGQGTEVIPQRIMLQVQNQMLCTESDAVYVGVWIADKKDMIFLRNMIKALKGEDAGFECLLQIDGILKDIDMRHYEIKRNQDMIDKIIDHCTWWWEKYVVTKTPPPMTEPPSMEIVKSIIRNPDKIVPVSAKAVDEYEFTCVNFRAAKSEKDEAKVRLLAETGDAKMWQYPSGEIYEYKTESAGEKINKELLKDRYPDVYIEVSYNGTRKLIKEVKGK